jgi:deoxyribonuclease V
MGPRPEATKADDPFTGISIEEAKSDQQDLRRRLVLQDDFSEVKLVGGADAAFSSDGRTVFGAVVVLSYPELELLEVVGDSRPVTFPYVPGYLSYREGPVIHGLFRRLQNRPDLVLFDGQGIAHPRGLGLASHLGVLLDIPSIGCAKSRLVGEYVEPGPDRGRHSPLLYKGLQVGWALRSRDGVRPVFVSPGHRVGLESARRITLACCRRYRLPEPGRLAHLKVGQFKRATGKLGSFHRKETG